LGADVQGIEPSRHGAELTRRQGIPVFEGPLEEFIAKHGNERFDVITASHVIEHVPDPVRTLAGLQQLLKNDGSITITVPNAASTFAVQLGTAWHSTDLPFHLHQFSPASMAEAAKRAGLTSIDLSTVSLPAASAHSLRMVLRQKWLIPQRVSERVPGMHWLGARIAAHHDAGTRGEALLARLA
jgi:SAM-dependent methyltransferase